MKEYIIKVDEPNERAWDGSRKVFETRELVRCKDCKYHGNINEDYCQCLEQETNMDFYCWYGQRRSE